MPFSVQITTPLLGASRKTFCVSLLILHICQNEWKEVFAKWIVFEYQLLAIRFIFLPLFYVCDCFASVHVCVLHACLFQQRPEERSLLCVLGIEPRSSIEQQVLIPTAEPCFQPWLLEGFLFLCF